MKTAADMVQTCLVLLHKSGGFPKHEKSKSEENCFLHEIYIHIEPASSAGEGGIHALHCVEDAEDPGADEVHR